jgi:hypothetical protein
VRTACAEEPRSVSVRVLPLPTRQHPASAGWDAGGVAGPDGGVIGGVGRERTESVLLCSASSCVVTIADPSAPAPTSSSDPGANDSNQFTATGAGGGPPLGSACRCAACFGPTGRGGIPDADAGAARGMSDPGLSCCCGSCGLTTCVPVARRFAAPVDDTAPGFHFKLNEPSCLCFSATAAAKLPLPPSLLLCRWPLAPRWPGEPSAGWEAGPAKEKEKLDVRLGTPAWADCATASRTFLTTELAGRLDGPPPAAVPATIPLKPAGAAVETAGDVGGLVKLMFAQESRSCFLLA